MPRRKRRPLGHLKAAPHLAAIEQNAWQRGYTDVAGWTKRKRLLFELGTTVAGCGFGFALGSTWLEKGLFAVLLAVVAFLLGLFGLWLWLSATAPVWQRDEARKYANALEAHAHEYAEWARRREIADDFRRETLEFASSVFAGSAAELDAHRRGNAAAVQAQLREHGASDDVTGEIDRQLAALKAAMEAKEDRYGNDDIRRIASSMQAMCQNVWSLTRSQDTPPTAPSPRAS
jgi:hypothetical protein